MIHHFIYLLIIYGLSFGLGLMVKHKILQVHDSRKILSISFFLIAAIILVYFPSNKSEFGIITNMITPLIWLGSLTSFFRNRIPFFNICFSCVDRPEDRPLTITWLFTAFIAGYWVLIFMVEWLNILNATHLIFITIFASTFGDGLAEPIGKRYGKYRYKAKALFTDKIYDRSIEGSMCVAIATISATIAMHESFTSQQFYVALALLPIVLTITEAKSPHTWDNPFMHLTGGLTTIGIIYLI
jgi:dolichol kinase